MTNPILPIMDSYNKKAKATLPPRNHPRPTSSEVMSFENAQEDEH